MTNLIPEKFNKNIIALLASTLLFAIASGINIVSLPLILYNLSLSTSLIGISSAIEILAGILIANFLHSLSRKIGLFKLIIYFALIQSTVILVISFYQNYAIWLLLIFISGMSWFSVIALRQSWLNIMISDKQRPFITSISSTFICIGVAVGPIIVKLIGAGNYKNFIISVSFILTSGLILFLIRNFQPQLEKQEFSDRSLHLIKKNPRIFLARFLLDFQCSILTIFTVSYGIKNGFSPENSGLLVSAFMGVGMLDFLIGLSMNNKLYKKYINIGFIGCLTMILALPIAVNNYYITVIIYVIYGWFTSLIFITSMAAANDLQKKEDLVSINSALQGSGAFGSCLGVLLAGILMQTLGNKGFIITIAVATSIYLIFINNEKNQTGRKY